MAAPASAATYAGQMQVLVLQVMYKDCSKFICSAY